jgi:DnaD/phage-associated family protein
MQFIAKWASDFKYDMSVIKCAYEITIDRIKEPSLPYANAILETWNKAGLRTLDDVQKYEAERSLKKPTAGGEEIKLGKSFDADVFFEKALERSLSEE